ncbi:DUF960 domain-containing protein [Levilactobacillus brevis]|uniref:DUF960 family protein n=1 Tax=Levilactobacillus brevis TaxID=1580 RepID=UPI0018694F32|nr:DUF960 family protein [Levilactobacillus brevis]QOP52899.1 DUF960 domain-containing protein [Levilactobacillus brevis]
MFESNHARYASYGTVAALPGEMIDAVWQIIDDDLQGLFPLANLLTFKLHNNQGQTTFEYVQTDDFTVLFLCLNGRASTKTF